MMLKSMRKHGITLALFAAGSTGLTAAINELTKSTIAEQAATQQKALFNQVLPADRYNNDLLQSCYLVAAPPLGKGQHKIWIAKNNDAPVGVVMEATAPDGYSGAIQLLVAADKGTVLGTRVTEHHETPGLGDKIELRLSDWITHFAGKVIHGPGDSHFAVKKTAVISISSPAPRLPHARWSTPLSVPACTRKRCPHRFLNSRPVESKP
jgi:electron transport complex protein RnfG